MELTPRLHAFLWSSPRANNCNTYLLQSPEKNILIDPGHVAYFDHVRSGLQRLSLTLDDIDLVICTHAHPDHIEAVQLFGDKPTRFTLHGEEWQLVEKMASTVKLSIYFDMVRFAPDFFLTEGDLTVSDITLAVYHTPGHSPGGVTLYWSDESALLTGDLIFKGGLGRTDLPGGDGGRLKESIRRMGQLDANWLLSGHGDVVSGSEAVKSNFKQVEEAWFGYV